jgi:hypothetical protein
MPMTKPVKPPIIVILGLVMGALLVTAWSLMRLFAVTENITTGVVALYSKDELFIFIGHGTSVLAGPRTKLWLERVAYIPQFPDSVAKDLLVVHFKEGKLSQYDLKGFEYSGSPFIYHGQLYWGRGLSHNDVGPSRWKWNGSEFIGLSDPEASLLNAQAEYFDEMTIREGWKQTSFPLRGHEPSIVVRLGDKELRLLAQVEPLSGERDRARVMLGELGSTNSPKVIIDITEGYQRITEREYLQLKAQKP